MNNVRELVPQNQEMHSLMLKGKNGDGITRQVKTGKAIQISLCCFTICSDVSFCEVTLPLLHRVIPLQAHLIVSQSDLKKRAPKIRSLELGGLVPQHNSSGTWTQQVVAKSTWQQQRLSPKQDRWGGLG